MKTRSAFTLIEVLIAISILSVTATVVFMAFSTVSTAWNKMVALSDDMHHGDYVMDQLFMGLRSTYTPDRNGNPQYAFLLEDSGSGADSEDKISWVKMGTALVGKECQYAGTPHRVEVFMDSDANGDPAIHMKSWSLHGQAEDFDPDKVEPVMLSRKVVGLNLRTMTKMKLDGTPDWQDDWRDTNRIPPVVELTLFLAPLEKDGDPVELKRICTIPCGQILRGN